MVRARRERGLREWSRQGGERQSAKVFHPEHKNAELKNAECVQANTLMISSFRGTLETELLSPNSCFCSVFKISHKPRGVGNMVWSSFYTIVSGQAHWCVFFGFTR